MHGLCHLSQIRRWSASSAPWLVGRLCNVITSVWAKIQFEITASPGFLHQFCLHLEISLSLLTDILQYLIKYFSIFPRIKKKEYDSSHNNFKFIDFSFEIIYFGFVLISFYPCVRNIEGNVIFLVSCLVYSANIFRRFRIIWSQFTIGG